jgi:LCP family protein required for cell wall assembly
MSKGPLPNDPSDTGQPLPLSGFEDDAPRQPVAPPPAPPAQRAAAGPPPPAPPPDDRATGSQPPRYEPSRKRGRWWFALPIAAVVYVALGLITLFQPINVAGLSLTVPIPGLTAERVFGLPDRPFTVMIVGLDVRPTQDGQPSRTDSVLLMQVDAEGNRAGIVSVPRDTMMQVPDGAGGYFQDRVNTAFVYNWSADDPSAAPKALAETIERNLGIKVDEYIIFDQRSAAEIIDAAGGVDVVVREAFGQEDYSDDDVNVVPQFFPEGAQHLSGYQAVAYGRIREGTSDFDRIRRQQQVAEALVETLSSPMHVTRLPGVRDAYKDGVTTSLSDRQSAGLFVLLKRIGSDRLVTRSLGDAAVSCSYCEAALVQLLPAETAAIIADAFGDDAAGQQAADLLVAAGVTP